MCSDNLEHVCAPLAVVCEGLCVSVCFCPTRISENLPTL